MKNETKQTAGQPSAISVASGNSQAPVSEEMELAVILSVVAQSTSICEVGERFRPEMFSYPDYCLVYRFMLALYQHETDIDMLSIDREMRRLNPNMPRGTDRERLSGCSSGQLRSRCFCA